MALDNKEEFIQYLLSKIRDVDIPSGERADGAVHWLCKAHSKKIAEMILKRGIDVNRLNKKGLPGPYYLVDSVPAKVAIDILELLIRFGYNVNLFSTKPPGETILSYYLRSIIPDTKVIEWLLKNGASPTIKMGIGKRPIDFAKPKILNLLNKYAV